MPDPETNIGLVEDCEVLLRIRATLEGTESLLWEEEIGIKEWRGIRLNAGGAASASNGQGEGVGGEDQPLRVRGFYPTFDHGRNLDGVLPPELGRLTEIEEIGLYRIIGDSYVSWLSGALPKEWGQLTRLRSLELPGHGLIGPIPPEWANLTDLTTLDLTGNFLSGCIGPEFSDIWVEGTELSRCEPTESVNP